MKLTALRAAISACCTVSIGAYIHGRDASWTIGTAASKGCIRMYNADVMDLYPRVPFGTR
jgi:lipoprotein-anchoring transpeptidase ErfK/SrfK